MTRVVSKNIWYGIYLAVAVTLLLEIVLRIYNPFHFRIKGDRIVLDVNKTYEINNRTIPVIDSHIVHTRNSLGFRGPDKPVDFEKYLSVVTVGGSTTECQYLNDGKTWSDQLDRGLKRDFSTVWLNNGGIAGHSTFGHIALLQDHISALKPKVVVFLVGINDIGRDDLNDSDRSNMTNSYSSFFTFLSKKSEVCNVIVNLFRARRARLNNLSDSYINLNSGDHDSLTIQDNVIQHIIKEHEPFRKTFDTRLQTLINICRTYDILPVLVTQPLLIGAGVDSVSGVNLETLRFNAIHNGKSFWMLMESYNDVSRKVAERNRTLIIDAARLMPKSSLYFYDMLHYTNAGAEKLGNLVYYELKDYLASKYPDHLKK